MKQESGQLVAYCLLNCGFCTQNLAQTVAKSRIRSHKRPPCEKMGSNVFPTCFQVGYGLNEKKKVYKYYKSSKELQICHSYCAGLFLRPKTFSRIPVSNATLRTLNCFQPLEQKPGCTLAPVASDSVFKEMKGQANKKFTPISTNYARQ